MASSLSRPPWVGLGNPPLAKLPELDGPARWANFAARPECAKHRSHPLVSHCYSSKSSHQHFCSLCSYEQFNSLYKLIFTLLQAYLTKKHFTFIQKGFCFWLFLIQISPLTVTSSGHGKSVTVTRLSL